MSILQKASLVNPSNDHISNPGMSSSVGAVSGCGAGNSSLALQQKGLYQVVKTGGKKKTHKHNKKRHHSHKNRTKYNIKRFRGGNGYGFSKSQDLASTSGVNSNGSVHLAGFSKYDNNGINSDTNMNASKQSGGSHDLSYGTGGYPYYSYKPTEGENLSVFAGSGYPPITRGLNSQCGGKKRRGVKGRKSRKSRKGRKSRKSKKSKKSRKGRKSRKSKKSKKVKRRQKGGYSQYGSNVANSHIYSTGAPPSLNASQSALANPPPYTPKNDCLNTWKHLGDTPPYNEIYK